jgi:hypothetical protein
MSIGPLAPLKPRNASAMALPSAGSDPEQPDSPTPLAPSALSDVGTGCDSVMIDRTSPARGMV